MTTVQNSDEGRVEPSTVRDPGTIALAEILRENAVVEANREDGYMIVTPLPGSSVQLRDPGMSQTTAIAEMGYTSPSPFTSWTRRDDNVKLHDHQGIKVYYNMRRQDGAVRSIMRLLKTPIMGAHWFIEPWKQDVHAPVTTQDQNVADFVERNLFESLNVSWSTLLSDMLLMTDYGYIAFEKVWEHGQDMDAGKIVLRKLAPRHPLDIQEWVYDRNGGPNGCFMFPNPYSGPSELGPGTGMDPREESWIPIIKLVVLTHEAEAGDLTGISVLRSVYKHWYYKDTLYKIDAIQKERHGIGIPIITLPPGFTDEDKALADNLGRNLRTNERAHIVVPPNWTITFAKLEGQPVDCMKSIEHHDMRIKSNVLGAFLDASQGTSDPNIDLFMKSTRYIADYICDMINTYVIPQLVNMNFVLGKTRGYPKLRARRIGEWEDMRTLSFAIRNLVGADVIRADDHLEAHVRREMDLPPADPTTARTPVMVRPNVANTPMTPGETTAVSDQALEFMNQGKQNGQAGSGTAPNGQPVQKPGQAGAPRQRKPGAEGTGRASTGTDRSGG